MVEGNSKFVIKGGTLIDSFGLREGDLVIEDGEIVASGSRIAIRKGYEVVDAAGCIVTPGFVDLHCHLREPGQSGSETVISGSRAGVLGGYSALLAMPNTMPPIDSVEVVHYIHELAKDAYLDVYVAGTITKGRLGQSITEMSKLADIGVKVFTDDGSGVQDPQLMRRALEYSKGLGVTLAQHCEDAGLANSGYINEGPVSSILGVRGMPNAAEDVMVARDIELVRLTGGRLHFLHISTARSSEMVSLAKSDGLPITAEVTPHHLTFDDRRVMNFDPLFKVNPPLRSAFDREALWKAYLGGVFDAVATDHAPHSDSSKDKTLDEASFGMLGLQAAFGAVAAGLQKTDQIYGRKSTERGDLSEDQLMHLVGSFTWRPAAIAQVGDKHGGPLIKGRPANICVLNPKQRWGLSKEDIKSLSFNSPYFDTELLGKVIYTFVNGEMVVKESQLCR